MVLKHHPDKRKARGLKVGDGEDDYFTCITRGNDGAGFDFSTGHLNDVIISLTRPNIKQ